MQSIQENKRNLKRPESGTSIISSITNPAGAGMAMSIAATSVNN